MSTRAEPEVVVIGAGMGGLVAALLLASRGARVTVLERAADPGGKLREVRVGGAPIDAGPTVCTLRGILDAVFAEAGTTLDAHVTLRRAEVLARHAWTDGGRLDLYADLERSADAIGAFAGAREAAGFRAFAARAARTWRTLERGFVHAERPTPFSLAAGAGVGGMGDLLGISPFTTLWRALGEHFADPRLRQLFGRYATYSGSSPFAAPATLMLIAHVEQAGVWLIEGGMHRLACALADLAAARGARFRYGAEVAAIEAAGGRVAAVRLADGERIAADAVICNAEVGALAAGGFGDAARRAVPRPAGARSQSAVTWAMRAEVEGWPLARHTVCFGPDYAEEFDATFGRARLPAQPTTYICAQDRDDSGAGPRGPERLLMLVNAPATGAAITPQEIDRCETATHAVLRRCGLTITPTASLRTGPAEWEQRFPGTGGALYGTAVHGWQASFSRPTARTRLPGLYLAGGSVHPGPGLPMAALSGRFAANALLADHASTRRSHRMAMPGGTSTR